MSAPTQESTENKHVTGERNKICHVVSFSLDEKHKASELTVRVRGKWFQISAEESEFQASDSLYWEYAKLWDAAQDQEAGGESERGSFDGNVNEEPEDPRPAKKQKMDDADRTSLDSGYMSDVVSERETNLRINEVETTDSSIKEEEETIKDHIQELQNWLLAPFGTNFSKLAPDHPTKSQRSLSEWYNSDIFFFTLKASKSGELLPVRSHTQGGYNFIARHIIPHMSLPKYLRALPGVPWISPADITVLSESDDPSPIHPALVRVNIEHDNAGQAPTEYFLKMVDPAQEPAIKRELRLLQEVKKLDLRSKGVRAPRLEGLVSDIRHPSSRTQILGFLLTVIADPIPLTQMIDPTVPQEKRENWAKESEEMVRILHKHGLVWGDAKADNFVVDNSGDGDLWMIDFGGSYTEGWVDPDLMETREGDEMGIEKIGNALKDPEEASYDPEERHTSEAGEVEVSDQKDGEFSAGGQSHGKGKRKHRKDEESNETP